MGEANPHDTQARRDLAEVFTYVGEAFAATRQWESALENCRKTVSLYQGLDLASQDLAVKRAYDTIGSALVQMGRQEEAIRSYHKAVELGSELLPKGHYSIALSKGALGECLTTQKRFSEAERLLLQSYESLKASQGGNQPRARLALQRLVALYNDWGKSNAADRYRDKLADLR